MGVLTDKTILLVEDEAVIALKQKLELEQEGYTVITASNGEQALDILHAGKEFVDLILMDLDLGDGPDGTEVASGILNEYDIPVVFISSHAEREIVQKTEKITSYGYVLKDSGIMVLDASIKMAFKLFESKLKEKRNYEALQESREMFRDLSDRAIVGIYLIQDNLYRYVNSMFCIISGYGENELTDKMGPRDIVYDEDWPVVEENIRQRIAGKSPSNHYELRIKTKTGDMKILEVYSARTLLLGKPAIIGTMLDITERKKSEIELKEINRLYRIITDNIKEGVFLADMDMKIKYITPSVTSRYGYSLDEINRIPLKRRMTEESYTRLRKMLAEDLAPENLADPGLDIVRVAELEYYRRDGSKYWLESTFRLIRDAGGRPAGLIGVGRDITARKEMEKALEESRESFRRLSEDIPAYICSFLPDSTMLYANPALAEITGISCNDLNGMKFFDLLDRDNLEIVKRGIESITISNPAEYHEQSYTGNDGRKYYQEWRNRAFFNDSGEVTHFLSVGVDITKRKEAEEKLEQRNRAIEAAIDGIAILDKNQQYIYLNRAYAEIYGYSTPDELTGKSWRLLYSNGELPGFDNEIMPLVMKEGNFRGTSTGKKKDHTTFRQELSLTALENGGLICIVRDITERELAEEQIQALLREKELLLKEIHHRVINNMNTVFGLLSLQADMIENPDTRNILAEAASRVKSMMILYNKLYRSELKTAISIKDYLPALINEIASIFPQRNSFQIITRIDDIVLEEKVLSPLGIIINELVTNSMKYALTGRDDGFIKVTAEGRGKRISIIYEDNGPDIPESVTFDNSTGFGLQLVGMLVKQMKGSASIQRGGGAKFNIEFSM